MEIWNNIVIFLKGFPYEIAINIIASIIFLLLVFIIYRPTIKIAPVICKRIIDNKVYYQIKIYNTSRFYKAFDINVELVKQKKQNVPTEVIKKKSNGATNLILKRLNIELNHIWYLTQCKSSCEHASYAYIFTCDSDIDAEWDESTTDILHFKVICKHELTGLPRIITQEYRCKSSCIKQGRYFFGKTFEINTNV